MYGVLVSCKKKKVRYTTFSSINKFGRSIKGFRRLNNHDVFFNKENLNYRVNFFAFIPPSEKRNKFRILVLIEKIFNTMIEFYYTLKKDPS